MSIVLLLFALSSAHADAPRACPYCAKLAKLEGEFRVVKPEAMNEKTADRQASLVTEAEALLTEALAAKTPPAADDWTRLLPFLATVESYDYDRTLAEDLSAALASQKRVEAFYDQVSQLEKSGGLSSAQTDRLRIAFGIAEHTIHEGTGGPATP